MRRSRADVNAHLPYAAAMAHGIPEVNFGRGPSFRLGVEEEFILVDPATGAVSHTGSELLARLPGESPDGHFAPARTRPRSS